eukprot:7530790-Pyramimonas_sp.AAC.1
MFLQLETDFEAMFSGTSEPPVFVSQFVGTAEEHEAARVIQGNVRYFLKERKRAEQRRLRAKFSGTRQQQQAAKTIQ